MGMTARYSRSYRRIIAMRQLKLVGLHCHVGTFILESDLMHMIATKKLVSLALEAEAMARGRSGI